VETFLETLVRGVMLGSVYALLALGLVLLFKSSRILNLAYGYMLMLLGYIFCLFFVTWGLPAAFSIILVFIIAALLGLVLDRFAFRPLIGQPIFAIIVLTLVLGFLFDGIAILGWKSLPLPIGLIPAGGVSLGAIRLPYAELLSFIIALLLFAVVVLLFQRAKIGLAMRCVAEDHQLSQSMGISVKRIFAISWAISLVIAAVAAILLGSMQTVSPMLSFVGLAKALPVILLGGLESIPGALVGGLIIGLAELFSITYLDPVLGGFSGIMPFILMLLILLIRPYGFFGLRIIERI